MLVSALSVEIAIVVSLLLTGKARPVERLNGESGIKLFFNWTCDRHLEF